MNKQILVVKCDSVEEYKQVCAKFHAMNCKWNDGTGKPGHSMNNLGSQDQEFARGVRYLLQYDNVIKQSMTDKGIRSKKFNILTALDFLK